jgi:hypothetical protein
VEEKIELPKKDVVCITRILQSCFYADDGDIFYGCKFCEYSEECMKQFSEKKPMMHIYKVRENLQNKTGLYLGLGYNPDNKDYPFTITNDDHF